MLWFEQKLFVCVEILYNRGMMRRLFVQPLFVITILLIVPLAFSVFYSGYHYTYYGDELVHVNTVYLIAHGYRPFKDFFTIYSPLFHYLLLPFFTIYGFTPETIQASRFLMIGLFALQLLIGYAFMSKLFTKLTGLIFVLLMLLDPFTVFAGMQVRPDNLLMLVFFAGVLTLVYAISHRGIFMGHHSALWFVSGCLMGLAVVISFKSIVMVGVLSLALFVYFLRKQTWRKYFTYVVGGVVAGILFCFLWIVQGSFRLMIEQLIVYPKAMSDGIWFPTRLGFFYQPNNTFVYGLAGKPVTWYIAVLLPIFALAGILYSLMAFRKQVQKSFWIITFICMLILQYAFLYTIKCLFIQYYLTVNWILAFFAAIFITAIVGCIKHPIGKSIMYTLLLIVFLCVSFESIRANMQRPHNISQESQNVLMGKRWERISSDSLVYPSLLFRPLSQPIPYGYFLPEIPLFIQKKYPLPLTTISDTRVEYLILTPFHLQFIDQGTKLSIEKNFTNDPTDTELWVRK